MFNLHSCYVKELDSSWRMDRTVTTHDLLIFITSGKLIYWVDNEKIPLQQGDILYIPRVRCAAEQLLNTIKGMQRCSVRQEPIKDCCRYWIRKRALK